MSEFVSLIIPIYNEADSIEQLYSEILESIIPTKHPFEIIFVNDGSTDRTRSIIERLKAKNPSRIVSIDFKERLGKTPALKAAFEKARGDIFLTMDGDLQDDPAEIPRFIQKIREGLDLVSGFKHKRRDPLSRRLASKIYNSVVSQISGVRLHDHNCGFKAYTREAALKIPLSGHLHRYMPYLAHSHGVEKIAEMKINHRRRVHGKSKYGSSRIVHGAIGLWQAYKLAQRIRPKPPQVKFKRISLAAAALLLGSQLAMQVYMSSADSQVTDESNHLYSAYEQVFDQNFLFNPEHPPLVKDLAAIPFLFAKPNPTSVIDKSEYVTSQAFLYTDNDAEPILFWSRMPMTMLTLALGILIYAVSVYFFGWLGGLFSVALYAFDPTIAAHGHYINTDIGASLGVLLSLTTYYLFLRRQKMRYVLLAGAALGIAQLMKFSALLLFPMLAALTCWYLYRNRGQFRISQLAFNVGIILAVCFIVILCGYHFQLNPISGLPFNFLLIPGDYFTGISVFMNHATVGHQIIPSQLFGDHSSTGWWYYFFVIFAIKTPIATIAMTGLASYFAIARRKENPFSFYLLLSGALYLGLCLFVSVNIGVRHILPLYPMIFVMSGMLVPVVSGIKIRARRRVGATLLIAVVFLLAVQYGRTFPYYLAYFNEFIGGSYNGYLAANDSNIDWGQDLKRIKAYIDSHNLKRPHIEYTWSGAPSFEYYGITSYDKFHRFDAPGRGYYIIGATSLDTQKFSKLKEYPIYDRIGPSVFVYKF